LLKTYRYCWKMSVNYLELIRVRMIGFEKESMKNYSA
jgi:hypothetical protein